MIIFLDEFSFSSPPRAPVPPSPLSTCGCFEFLISHHTKFEILRLHSPHNVDIFFKFLASSPPPPYKLIHSSLLPFFCQLSSEICHPKEARVELINIFLVNFGCFVLFILKISESYPPPEHVETWATQVLAARTTRGSNEFLT